MFEKLLSMLPYNPSLNHQLSFYGKRMREEAGIRRVGIGFLALAFLVQFVAVTSPPQASAAYSNSDMINGGFTERSEAVSACRNNTKEYGDVLAAFGISCDAVSKGEIEGSVSSTSHDNQLYTLGWVSDGDVIARTGKKTHEVALNLDKVSQKIYARKLSAFDTYDHSSYKMLKVKASNGTTYWLMFRCGNLVTVGVPTPLPKPAPAPKPVPKPTPAPTPQAKCPLDSSILATDANCIACPYDSSILRGNPKCLQCPNPNHGTVSSSSPECVPLCQYNGSLDQGSPQCKPCTEAQSEQDALACVSVRKTAANTTQNVADANNTTVKAGDTIVYTLYAQNNGKATIKDYVFEENLSDVLDYADVVSLGGGTAASDNQITWAKQDIKAGDTASVTVTVKVKDPIPSTPTGASDPTHFDLVMTNVYGTSVNIKVPSTPVKQIEVTTTTLPNTGPGTSLVIAGSIMVVAGYFYSRSRLLAKESQLAIQANAA